MAAAAGDAPARELLPTGVVPRAYAVHVRPDMPGGATAFSGDVVITVDVSAEGCGDDVVVLHAYQLDISAASFAGVASESISYDTKAQTASLKFPKGTIVAGKESQELKATFTGVLNEDMDGFYRSEYKTLAGEKRAIAVTQFEATGARRAFPCFDEPSLKATFEVTLTYQTGYDSLSNMLPAETSTDDAAGTTTVKFAPTVKMSSYLLAWAVFRDFEYVEAKTKGGIPTRVWAPPGKKDDGHFALDVSCKVLDFFTEYFDIPFPLPKIDHIAYPDFAAGAMENWGLITYRETALLIDKNASVAQRQRVANVVAHELAHQWFGNLVSPAWWDDLWLNEAFATYIASLAVDHLFPEWNEWVSFVSGSVLGGMELDQLESSHPVQVPVANALEVMQIFDAISYHKGSSILRHVMGELGPTAFRDGLRIYLKRHAYGNTVGADLFAAWSESSGLDVAAIVTPFVTVTGFPLVSVSKAAEQPASGGIALDVSQRRFLSSGKPEATPTTWPVPLRPAVGAAGFTSGDGTRGPFVKTASERVELEGDASSFLKLNRDQTGFYRVTYSDELWAPLLAAARKLEVPAIDRVGLVSDATALSFACEQPGSRVLELGLALADSTESEPDVVQLVVNAATRTARKWNAQDPATHKQLSEGVVARIAGPFLERIGREPKDGEADLVKQLRASLLAALLSSGDADTVAFLRAQFAQYVKDPTTVSSDIRPVAFMAEVGHGGDAGYTAVRDLFEKETVHAVKLQALRALGRSPDIAKVADTIEYAMTDAVKPQDFFYAVASIGPTSAAHAQAIWSFYQKNWDRIADWVGNGMSMKKNAFAYGVQGLNSAADADAVEKFFATKDTSEFKAQLAQSLEQIRATANWVDHNKDSLPAWLKTQE